MSQTQEEINLVVQSTVESIVASIRNNCTPPSDAYTAGGDRLIGAVADWVEHPPEWVKATWADQARANPRSRTAAPLGD
ncbi:hypothetical protein B7R22_05290 [Subtercola boreus]|uniref:Uncharacterized protein n=1 Tax=Subtercola boreus TaxID=120213 RepID=A0A3E0W0J3_9MICO|nr:hypothetical protein [Subtercola boreus]RFA15822.1 hypothetical protein B7R22_05290 [Subtercola boreus]